MTGVVGRARAAGATGLLALAFVAFVALGLPEATLGVAWPTMRVDLDQPLSALGILLAMYTGGYLAASTSAGAIVGRLGIGRLLALAATVSGAAMVGYAVTPTFAVLVPLAAASGLGAGLVDTGLNAHLALHHGPRAMNLLHASFGVGATLGPLAATVVIGAGASWRLLYAFYAVIQAGLVCAFLVTRADWSGAPEIAAGPGHAVHVRRRGVLAGSLGVFFLYTGIEVAVGAWSFTLLTEGRGMATTTAGLWVTSYWAGITVGRGLMAVAGRRIAPERALVASMAGTLVGALVLWADPGGAGALGLPVLGLSFAAIFPSLVLLTPRRLGADRTTAAVGWQLAFASLGAAMLPAAVGVAAEDAVTRIGGAIAVIAVAMVTLHLVTARAAGERLGGQAA